MTKLSLVAVPLLALFAAPAVWAAPITFTAHLTGAAENPSNGSPGTGDATVTFDLAAHFMSVDVTFSGLTGTTTASHIHCCAVAPGNAMVATQTPTFVGFPLGVTGGTYSNSFDMSLASSYNPAFVTANGGIVASAEQVLFDGLLAGTAYFNIHSSVFPGGEIRGFLVAVPEPATLGVLGLGLVSLLIIRRQSRG